MKWIMNEEKMGFNIQWKDENFLSYILLRSIDREWRFDRIHLTFSLHYPLDIVQGLKAHIFPRCPLLLNYYTTIPSTISEEKFIFFHQQFDWRNGDWSWALMTLEMDFISHAYDTLFQLLPIHERKWHQDVTHLSEYKSAFKA